ncbi:hypothetical protein J3458_019803 [Metarhizium acridum]|uniref:uncharacterized protein n=1 Tax=Metarhizium acridum TaxID=92637 RepID=UPI001C6B23F1|nr:hypothetical protein J3458_019803 [Metarhizium acridum]
MADASKRDVAVIFRPSHLSTALAQDIGYALGRQSGLFPHDTRLSQVRDGTSADPWSEPQESAPTHRKGKELCLAFRNGESGVEWTCFYFCSSEVKLLIGAYMSLLGSIGALFWKLGNPPFSPSAGSHFCSHQFSGYYIPIGPLGQVVGFGKVGRAIVVSGDERTIGSKGVIGYRCGDCNCEPE